MKNETNLILELDPFDVEILLTALDYALDTEIEWNIDSDKFAHLNSIIEKLRRY